VTLGLFLATFVFATIVLITSRSSVVQTKQVAPIVSVTVMLGLTMATVFGFVAYLHGVVRLMRVQYLLEMIADETRKAVDENFPPLSAYVDVEPPVPDPAARSVGYSGRPGVVTACDLHDLVMQCQQQNGWLELTVGVGEYLAHETPLALVHDGNLTDDDVTRCLLVRGERTFVQDPGFGFRQLADVAVRALSPGINDPTTAVQAIDRIGDLLAVTGARPDPTGLRVDAAGTVRIKGQLRGFEALLVLATTEILRYGADAPQVVRRMRAMLDELERTLPQDRHGAIARQRALLEDAVTAGMAGPFQAVAAIPDRQGFG
jgi:uncharacterized membrane protein